MKNRDYWKKRFIAIENQNTQKTKKYFENLENQFKRTNKKIDAELSTWYRRFAVNNNISLAEAKKLLNSNELKEFKWDVNEYIKYGKENAINQRWMKELENASIKKHVTRLDALKLQLQNQVEVLYDEQKAGYTKLAKSVYHDTYYKTAFEIQKGFNVGYDLNGYSESMFEKALNQTWGSDGSNFFNRSWKHKEQLINTLNNELTLNIIKGNSVDNAIKTIAKKFNTSKFNAGRLVMTESAFLSSVSQKQCYKNLDVEQYEYVSTLDSHTSKKCRDMDGRVFKMSEYEPGVKAPPLHPYCRSCTCPYFDDNYGERIARDENGKKYFVPSDMKYKDWYDRFVNHNKNIDLDEFDIKGTYNATINTLNWKKYANEIKDKYDIEIDKDVFNLDLESVKSSFAGVEKMINDFPEIKPYIKVFGVINEKVMSTSFNGALLFNKKHYSNNIDYLTELCKNKIWINNCTPKSLGIHEGGHLLERLLIDMYYDESVRNDVWEKCLLTEDIVLTACYNVKKKSLKHLTDSELRRKISLYADLKDNYSDCFAEAFADVYTNGDNSSELAKEIQKETLRRLRRGK